MEDADTWDTAILAGYVPRLVENHHRAGSGERLLVATGTLVSADISGFTALSERLAELGNEGAEQLTDLLNRCFTRMIDACEMRGGDIVKFGGDALLVLFTGDEHARDAAIAMSEMHRIVTGDWSTDSIRRVSLGISQGAHSGTIGFSLTDAGHLELLVGGPAVTATVKCEGDAERNQVLVTNETARLLPAAWLGQPVAGGHPLRVKQVGGDVAPPTPPPARGSLGLDRYLPRALAEQVVVGVPGEHRHVVVAFVHVAGVDDLFEASGAVAVHEACLRIGANVRSVLDTHPVHLLATDVYVNGFKLILTAGAPLSTDADDDHLLLALHDLFALDSPLPIRAGVNRGHVFVGDLGGPTRRTLTVMGDAVNLAARLMQAARPGHVVVADAVLDAAETQFRREPLEPFTVKGKSRPVHASVLGEPIGTGDDHISHIGFVGRETELATLDQLATAAAGGHGCLVEVTGEPGIGKSRLLREAIHQHPELAVHRMRGGQYARNAPFFVFRQLLRELLSIDATDPAGVGDRLREHVAAHTPHLTKWLPLIAIVAGADVAPTKAVDRLAEQFRRDRLLAATADLVEASLDRPVTVLAEDVHLFDTGSLDLLRALAARAHERPWYIVTTHRGSPGLVSPAATVIQLAALAPGELSRLAVAAGEMSGLVPRRSTDLERLTERAGGNPFFLLELVGAATTSDADHLPDNVESLVTTRIDLLPPMRRTLLREAAVAGNVVLADVLADAFERPELCEPGQWTTLDPFLISEAPGTYRFRHSLYRDVAYAGLSYRRRREAHAAIGTTLELRHGDDLAGVASLLSDHFERARESARAWRYAVIGGDGARDAYANIEAANLYERALRNADDDAATERARVAEALGDVRELNGEYSRAVAAYQLSRSCSDRPHYEVRLLRKIGGVRVREGRLSQSLRWFSRAHAASDAIDHVEMRQLEYAEIALGRAGALHRQGRHRKSLSAAQQAAEAADSCGHDLTRAKAYNLLEVAARTLGRPEAAEYSDTVLALYAGSGDLVGEANVLNNRGVRHHFAGEWDRALEEYGRSRTLRQQAGDVVGEAMAASNMAEILCLQGHFDEARTLFTLAHAAWDTAGYTVGVAYVIANLAMVDARAGDPRAGLVALADAATLLEQVGASALLVEIDLRRVECHLLAGDPSAALAVAHAVQKRLAAEHDTDEQVAAQLRPLLALAQLRTGQPDAAAATLAVAAPDGLSDRYSAAMELLAAAELTRVGGGDPQDEIARSEVLLDQLGAARPALFPVAGRPR